METMRFHQTGVAPHLHCCNPDHASAKSSQMRKGVLHTKFYFSTTKKRNIAIKLHKDSQGFPKALSPRPTRNERKDIEFGLICEPRLQPQCRQNWTVVFHCTHHVKAFARIGAISSGQEIITWEEKVSIRSRSIGGSENP